MVATIEIDDVKKNAKKEKELYFNAKMHVHVFAAYSRFSWSDYRDFLGAQALELNHFDGQ